MLAWLMRTNLAINLIQKWSYDYIKMDCEGGKCYGVLAVRVRLFGIFLLELTRLLGSSNLLCVIIVPRHIECVAYWSKRHQG